MRIAKSKYHRDMAVVTMGRDSVWGGRDEHPDARDLDTERRAVREAAEDFCRRHGLRGYEVFASAANGGYTVDVVERIDD